MSLDRDGLLAALKRKVEAVEVPEMGTVHFREMTVRERTEFNKRLLDDTGKIKLSQQEWDAYIAAASISDAEGNLFFTDDQLFDQSAVLVGTLARHAERINGLGTAASADAEKNSGKTAKSTSASTSPKPST
jgi:hypothetical protein